MNVETGLNNTVDKAYIKFNIIINNKPVNGEELGEMAVFGGKITMTQVMYVYSHDYTKSLYSIEYSICVHWPKGIDMMI